MYAKISSFIIIVIVALAVIAGVFAYIYFSSVGTEEGSHQESSTQPTASPSSTEASSVKKGYVVVEDALGRKVNITLPVKRIVCTYMFAPPFLYLLGGRDVFVAGWLANKDFYKLIDPDIDQKVAYGRDLSVEQIIQLNPDLVIAPTWKSNDKDLKQVESLGIPVIYISIESVDEIKNTILMLGKILDKEELANKIVNYYEQILANITSRVSGISEKPRVLVLYYSAKHHAYRTLGGDMFQSKLVELAGGEVVTKDIEGKKDINIEQIVSWNPDVILILQYYGMSAEDVRNTLLSDEALKEVNAVKNNKVYIVPNDGENWVDPCPKWILGLAWTAKILHPDVFSDFNITSMAASFYKEFFNITIDQVTLTGDIEG